MIRRGWSYKEDRRLSELAGSGKTLEQIAKTMDRTTDLPSLRYATGPQAKQDRSFRSAESAGSDFFAPALSSKLEGE
jgi:hypothetical protein